VHEPGRGLGTGQVGDQLGAPLDRDMLEDQQVDHQRPQVRAVADGRISDISGTGRDVRASAAAPATVQVVLDHLRRHLRHLMHLMRTGHPLIGRVSQVGAAPHDPVG
jgi:hypothetical protein